MAKGKQLEAGERVILKEDIDGFKKGMKGTVGETMPKDGQTTKVKFDNAQGGCGDWVVRNLLLRIHNEGTPKGQWMCKDGTLIDIVKMSDSHICNSLRFWFNLHGELIWSMNTELGFMRGVAEERGLDWNTGKPAEDPKQFIGVNHMAHLDSIAAGDRVVMVVNTARQGKGDEGTAVTHASAGTVRVRFDNAANIYEVNTSWVAKIKPTVFTKGQTVEVNTTQQLFWIIDPTGLAGTGKTFTVFKGARGKYVGPNMVKNSNGDQVIEKDRCRVRLEDGGVIAIRCDNLKLLAPPAAAAAYLIEEAFIGGKKQYKVLFAGSTVQIYGYRKNAEYYVARQTGDWDKVIVPHKYGGFRLVGNKESLKFTSMADARAYLDMKMAGHKMNDGGHVEGFVGIKHDKVGTEQQDAWLVYVIENGAEKVLAIGYSWEDAVEIYNAEANMHNEPPIIVGNGRYEVRYTGEFFNTMQLAKNALKKLQGLSVKTLSGSGPDLPKKSDNNRPVVIRKHYNSITDETHWSVHKIENGMSHSMGTWAKFKPASVLFWQVWGKPGNEISMECINGMNRYVNTYTGDDFYSQEMAVQAVAIFKEPNWSAGPVQPPPSKPPTMAAAVATLVAPSPVVVTTRTVRKIIL